jgi:hypothetical protein
MGQSLPVPEKIPYPRTTKQSNELVNMGIVIHSIPEEEKDKEHATYELPEGWRMVNTNPDGRQDLPEWHILDEKNQMRVLVSGHWRVSYDNNLHLRILDPRHLQVYTPSISKIEPHDKRWKKYLKRYEQVVLLGTQGWLLRQIHVDLVYEELVTFCKEHPSYESQLPKKCIVLKK